MAKAENVTINSELGLSREDVEIMVQQQLAHGMPAREVEGAAGIGLYLAGRAYQKVRRGIGKGIKGAIGSVLVIPKETEVVVITRRSLSRGGAVEYSVAGGFLTRVSSSELDQGIGVRPGTAAIKIPIIEQAEKIEAVNLHPFNDIADYTPELGGVAVDMKIRVQAGANFAQEREVIVDKRGARETTLVTDGNPIRFSQGFRGNMDIACNFAVDRAISKVFQDDDFRGAVSTLMQGREDIPTAEISALVQLALPNALVRIGRETVGLSFREKTIAVDPKFPDYVEQYVEAGLQAQATVIEGSAEAQVVGMQAAQITRGIVEGCGGPEGVATILGAFTGRRNQIKIARR